jgi:malonyl-CoA decarboxylase
MVPGGPLTFTQILGTRILGVSKRFHFQNGVGIPPAAGLIELCRILLSERGEVSGIRIAQEILKGYRKLNPSGRDEFFDALATGFSPDPVRVSEASTRYLQEPSAVTLAELQRVTEPPRQELFRRLNMAPDGTQALVRMRQDLISTLSANSLRQAIDADLLHLFSSWFNRGFLTLQRIDWRTPATVLEKIIEYEAVHQIQGWRDLRRRLEADRRCYSFFHPALPDEPIIFLEVALERGISGRIQPLIDPDSPVRPPDIADTAVFYSITNCQRGLRNVPFGSFLIKQVVETLRTELPHLKTFVTLSPIPGFRAWLEEAEFPGEAAKAAKRLSESGWMNDARLEREMLALCAYYLTCVRKGPEPFDPVGRFHLRNGARVERLNWMADVSDTGSKTSATLMANYLYTENELEKNHERYMKDFRVNASREIRTLARRFSMPPK